MFGPLRQRRDQMLLEVPCLIRREPGLTTAGAKLQRAFQKSEVDPEPGERRERVGDQPTDVTGDMIALLRLLERP